MSSEQVALPDERTFAEKALYAQGWPSVNRDAIGQTAISVAAYALTALRAKDAALAQMTEEVASWQGMYKIAFARAERAESELAACQAECEVLRGQRK